MLYYFIISNRVWIYSTSTTNQASETAKQTIYITNRSEEGKIRVSFPCQ